MIYFFNVNHELVKVVTSENVISARHEQELNGIIISDVELDLNYTKSFIDEVSLFGYYYKGTFYLHNIQRVEDFHGDDLVSIHGRHIFFNDMQYGQLIEDVRPTDRNAYDMLAQTIEANTRWSLDFHATTGRLSTNFYWKTPYEVLEWIVNNFRLEYEPRILFDGLEINGYMLYISNSLGSNTGIRIPYGDRVLSLTHDIDYSEVITRLAPRGKGELLEGGSYGRRINIKDVEVNQDGVVSPIGDYYLEDTSIAHQYESDRHAEIIFEDIEDVNVLIEEGISAYQDMSRPKMNFEADVQDIGDVNIGDSVAIVRHEYEIYFSARVHTIVANLLNESDAQVELGDYEHFKESKSERAQRRVRENLIRESERFDREVQQMREEFEQALIDAHAEIAAIDERMSTEIANEIAEFESAFNLEVQAAKDLAEQQIADTEQRINTTIDTARTEMEQEFNAEVERIEQEALAEYDRISGEITDSIDQARSEIENDYTQAVTNAREYAEQQAEQHANVVDSKLETMRDMHAGLIQQNQDNIANVNDFIGNQTSDLSGILQTLEQDFNQKIARETWHYNLLRGTQFDEDFWSVGGSTHGAIFDDEPINYWHYNEFSTTDTGILPYIQTSQSIELKTDVKYRLSFDVQTHGMKQFDYTFFITDDGTSNFSLTTTLMTDGNIRDVPLGAMWRRIWVEFVPERDVTGFIRIGTQINNNPFGRRSFKVRRPYLTESENIQWLYHLDDNMQNLEEVTMRVTELETGFETLITRTEYDNKTGQIEGTIRSIEDTVDGYSSTIQNHEDWIATNGSSIEHTIDGFDSKVWLNDIHNPNMIPYSNFENENSVEAWSGWNAPLLTQYWDEWLRVRRTTSSSTLGTISPRMPIKLIAGQTYTVSWETHFNVSEERVDRDFSYMYVIYANQSNRGLGTPTLIGTKSVMVDGVERLVYQYELTFTAHYTDNASIMFGTNAQSGQDNWFFMRHPKLEPGNRATPYYTAFSGLTQRVDEISLHVQDIDGSGLVRQSDITVSPSSVRIGSTEILGDDVLASVLNVSPSAIDMITQKMRLSGDLYVDGDITALAISAVEGNFASLIVSNLETNKLRARHINANAIGAEHLWIDSALINKLSTSTLFTDMLTAKTISAVEGNFADLIVVNLETNKLRARHINANAIGADHLYVTNGMIEKLIANTILTDEMTARSIDAINGRFASLFASEIATVDLNASNITTGTLSSERLQVNNALINRLISNSILTSEMRAQSLTAVRADIADLRTRILTADVITSEHISSSNALIDKLFASSALISRLTSKSAFISQLRTIDLAAEQVRVGFNGISNNVTINSSGITIDRGALTVNRTDGGAPTIIDGVNPSGIALFPATPHRRDSEFTIQGQYAVRDSGSNFLIYDFYMFEWFYSDLMLDFAIYNFENHDIRVRIEITGTDGSTFSKAVDYTIPHTPTRTRFPRMILNLGVPDGSLQRFFIRARNVGTTSQHGRFGIHTYMVKHLDNGHGYPRLEI